jgi:hypothetical protein
VLACRLRRPACTLATRISADHLHVIGKDVSGVVLHAVLFVGAILKATFDVDLATLLEVFGSDFRSFPEQLYSVPFGFFDLLAFLILTVGKSASGKYQYEVLCVAAPSGNQIAGVADRSNLTATTTTYLGNGSVEAVGHALSAIDTALSAGGTVTGTGASWAVGDVLTFALDLTLGTPTITIYKNGAVERTVTLPTGKTWCPAASMESSGILRLKTASLTYPVAGFTDWG